MFTYSKPIKTGLPTRKNPTRVSHKRTRGVGERKNEKFALEKSIQIYRMWFLFLKLGLDCQDNKIPIIDHKEDKKIKVKVSKSYYKEWDLELVRTLTFDRWWDIKRGMFLESKPELVKGSEKDNDYLYIKVDKRQKAEDVVRGVRGLLKDREIVPNSKYIIKHQHKYIATHMKYNIFIWKNLGKTRSQISKLLEDYYHYLHGLEGTRIPTDESSIRRLLRGSEKVILDTAVGEF